MVVKKITEHKAIPLRATKGTSTEMSVFFYAI